LFAHLKLVITILAILLSHIAAAQFSTSSNQRYLLKNGQPFFWLGDTGWELFNRLTKEEAVAYFKKRSEQGFTIIQAVALAELDGLVTANRYGNAPLFNNNPETPNEKYFELVDWMIDKANEFNLNIALLPTWGDKYFKDSWGKGPEIFNEHNGAVYAAWLANRYKNKTNIIWVLGGDRDPHKKADEDFWSAMGNAIMTATDNKAIISFHPQASDMGSAKWFHQQPWLAFNMFQNGHCRDREVYNRIETVYNLQPVKPVIDAEPIYEDHPVCFNEEQLGTSSAYDVRKFAYLSMFAGAFGHTYGCHGVWQFYAQGRKGINNPHFYWSDALDLPGANQMKYLRMLLQSFPMEERIPSQQSITENNLTAFYRIQCTKGKNYLLVYSAAGKSFTVKANQIEGKMLNAIWYNPSDGTQTPANEMDNSKEKLFTPPSAGYGKDWVLVLFEKTKNYSISKNIAQQ
jgi:hypothetical protein